MTWTHQLAAGCLAVGIVCASVIPADADGQFVIDSDKVTTMSGIASDSNNQVFWVANGGSNSSAAYAVKADGAVVGTMDFGRPMRDPQALVYRSARLYVADIGDAQANRESIHVYRYQNPVPGSGTPGDVRDIELKYADGKSRDARALLVGNSGRVFVITHEAKGSVWATSSAASSKRVNELQRIGDAPAWVTDATYLPDGQIAVRTYVSVQVLDPTGFTVSAAVPTPYQKQGEAMTVGLDDASLMLGSAGAKQQLVNIVQPTTLAKVPAAANTPPPPPQSPKPTPTAASPSGQPTAAGDEAPQPAIEDSTASDAGMTGTTKALLLSAVVAALAAAVVFLTGRPRGAVRSTGASRAVAAPAAPAADQLVGPQADEPAECEPVMTEPEDIEPEDIEPEVGEPEVAGPQVADLAATEFAVTSQPELDEPVGQPVDPYGGETPLIASAPAPADASFTMPAPAEPTPAVDVPPSAVRPGVTWTGAGATEPVPSAPHETGPAPRRSMTIVEPDTPDPRPRRAFTIIEDADRPVPRRGIPAEAEGAWVEPHRSDEARREDLDWLYPEDEK